MPRATRSQHLKYIDHAIILPSRRPRPPPKPSPRLNAASQPDCKLFNTPAEIRNRIYELAFEGEESHIRDSKSKTLTSNNAALLTSCKVIYAEARQIYYNNCTFHLYTISSMQNWLRQMGPASRASLRQIRFAGEWKHMWTKGRGWRRLGPGGRKTAAQKLLCKVDEVLRERSVALECGAVKVQVKGDWYTWAKSAGGKKKVVHDRGC